MSTAVPSPSHAHPSEAPFDERYTHYQTDRSWLRRLVRRAYLAHAARFCRGRTIDYGCGIGQLLERLPAGSVGVEINPVSVEYCQARGLHVFLEVPAEGSLPLSSVPPGDFDTLIISHVLEHLTEPDRVLNKLLSASTARGVHRIVIIVPGVKGYASDATHRTFIDERYLRGHGLLPPLGWALTELHRFPVDFAWFGTIFTHNELVVVLDRRANRNGAAPDLKDP